MENIRKTQEIGGALFISIPSHMADKMGIGKGTYLSIECEQGTIKIRPVRPAAKMNAQAQNQEHVKVGGSND